jgi:hypothetical protein
MKFFRKKISTIVLSSKLLLALGVGLPLSNFQIVYAGKGSGSVTAIQDAAKTLSSGIFDINEITTAINSFIDNHRNTAKKEFSTFVNALKGYINTHENSVSLEQLKSIKNVLTDSSNTKYNQVKSDFADILNFINTLISKKATPSSSTTLATKKATPLINTNNRTHSTSTTSSTTSTAKTPISNTNSTRTTSSSNFDKNKSDLQAAIKASEISAKKEDALRQQQLELQRRQAKELQRQQKEKEAQRQQELELHQKEQQQNQQAAALAEQAKEVAAKQQALLDAQRTGNQHLEARNKDFKKQQQEINALTTSIFQKPLMQPTSANGSTANVNSAPVNPTPTVITAQQKPTHVAQNVPNSNINLSLTGLKQALATKRSNNNATQQLHQPAIEPAPTVLPKQPATSNKTTATQTTTTSSTVSTNDSVIILGDARNPAVTSTTTSKTSSASTNSSTVKKVGWLVAGGLTTAALIATINKLRKTNATTTAPASLPSPKNDNQSTIKFEVIPTLFDPNLPKNKPKSAKTNTTPTTTTNLTPSPNSSLNSSRDSLTNTNSLSFSQEHEAEDVTQDSSFGKNNVPTSTQPTTIAKPSTTTTSTTQPATSSTSQSSMKDPLPLDLDNSDDDEFEDAIEISEAELLKQELQQTLREHPEYIKMLPENIKSIISKLQRNPSLRERIKGFLQRNKHMIIQTATGVVNITAYIATLLAISYGLNQVQMAMPTVSSTCPTLPAEANDICNSRYSQYAGQFGITCTDKKLPSPTSIITENTAPTTAITGNTRPTAAPETTSYLGKFVKRIAKIGDYLNLFM